MPYNNLIEQIKRTVDNIKNLDVETALNTGNLQPWNGLNDEDFRRSLSDLIGTLETALEMDLLKEFPHNILNSLNSGLTTLFTQLNNFAQNKNQQHFQNSFAQLETNRTNIRTWGLKSYVDYGSKIEDTIQGFNAEYQKIIEKSREIDALEDNVKKLIEPAVAGSLSDAFSRRQEKLFRNQIVWLVLTVIAGIASIWATIYVIDKLVELYHPTIPTNATKEQIAELLNSKATQNTVIYLRLGILIPLYTLFSYFFSHYNKERNLEEEYAHKAAVAASLPNYGNLAGDPAVKDQIISNASNVVFTSPIQKKGKVTNENKSIGEINSLFDIILNLVNIKK
jgi:hypothetical protein